MLINSDADLKRLFETVKTIAVVGCSPKPERAGHYVAKYLQDLGYRIIPVNPGQTEILGEKCYASLRDIPEPVDMIDCFRKAEDIPPIVEDAIAIGAKFVWMQLGIVNEEAAERAIAAGIEVVMDRCPKIDYPRLFR
ncbi:MAG TPA: CoA-binding protein [Rhodocyclaceae bacterium]|jgi:predicted CoA-binding protein|nr:CoA-binding protein [Rhodocyclaceae bacterium]